MSDNSNIPPHLEHLKYAEEHGVLYGKKGWVIRRNISRGVHSDWAYKQLEYLVKRHQVSSYMAGAFPLPQHLDQGEICLGRDQRNQFVRLPLEHWSHTFTLGQTGSGKTNQSLGLALQISTMIKGVWLFDFMKDEFSKQQRPLGLLGVPLEIVKARDLRLNILQCPTNTDPRDYASRLSDTLALVLVPSAPRANKLLNFHLLKLYHSFGIIAGGKNYPNLFDLRNAVAKDTKANAQARQAIVDGLNPILASLGNVLAYRVGWSTSDLANRRIVFQLGGIGEVEKNLILNSLLLSEFTSRVNSGISNPKYRDLWICCDEASRIISSSNSSGGISDLFGVIRGTGIAVSLSNQYATGIDHHILSNCVHKFVGRCGSASDYDVIGSAMGLSQEQRHWLIDNSAPGVFVAQLDSKWRKPFVLKVPKVTL